MSRVQVHPQQGLDCRSHGPRPACSYAIGAVAEPAQQLTCPLSHNANRRAYPTAKRSQRSPRSPVCGQQTAIHCQLAAMRSAEFAEAGQLVKQSSTSAASM